MFTGRFGLRISMEGRIGLWCRNGMGDLRWRNGMESHWHANPGQGVDLADGVLLFPNRSTPYAFKEWISNIPSSPCFANSQFISCSALTALNCAIFRSSTLLICTVRAHRPR